jgi:hypothetical protein
LLEDVDDLTPLDSHDFSNIHCHCEPFAPVTLTPMQSGEESRGAQDRLREAISINLFEIATSPRFHRGSSQ